MSRPTVAEIDLDAVRFNLDQLRAKTRGKAEILAVVKANAYGHGAAEVARELESAGAPLFGVATMEEGVELRKSVSSLPIVILGGIYPGDFGGVLDHNLSPVIFDLEAAKGLSAEAKKSGRRVSVHLKVDTGMNRLGVPWREWREAIEFIRSAGNLVIEGIMSHLSVADSEEPDDRAFTEEQTRRFQACLETARGLGIQPRYVHLANSAGVVRDLPGFNLVRPGLLLYGVHPAPALRARILLRPALRWKTAVLSVKRVPAGEAVSYGRTHCCPKESLVVVLPVGYADGYSRRFSNRGEVLVRGRRVKIVGIVCMDLTMADVSEIPDVHPGEEVVLLGRQGSEEIGAAELAGWAGTIPYEILCGIGKRVPRVYLR